MLINTSIAFISFIYIILISSKLKRKYEEFNDEFPYNYYLNQIYSNKLFANLVIFASKIISNSENLISSKVQISKKLLKIGGDLHWAAELSQKSNVTYLLKLRNNMKTQRALLYSESALLVLFTLGLVITGKIALTSCIVYLILTTYYRISGIKFQYTKMGLHPSDIINYISPSSIRIFIHNSNFQNVEIDPFVIFHVILMMLLVVLEPAGIDRQHAIMLFLSSIGIFYLCRRYFKLPRNHESAGFFYDSRILLLDEFIEAIFLTINIIIQGKVLEIANDTAILDAQFGVDILKEAAGNCSDKHPNIILILNESTFNPKIFYPNTTNIQFNNFFVSDDQKEYFLNVETFGGGTWRSEYSLFTGIPIKCYGSFGDQVFHWSKNKIKYSLINKLKTCGYVSGMLYPVDIKFAGANIFFSSIGFDHIIDMYDQLSPSFRERDSLYYENALNFMEEQFRRSSDPLFLYIVTMWNHFDHDFDLDKSDMGKDKVLIQDSEYDEYNRRLQNCINDYRNFKNSLVQKFPNKDFLIFRFGDHQPPFTANLHDLDNDQSKIIQKTNNHGVNYKTFWSYNCLNFEAKINYNVPQEIDICYLGLIILDAAGIPDDNLSAIRRRVMLSNSGRLYDIDSGKTAAAFNKKMIDMGYIDEH